METTLIGLSQLLKSLAKLWLVCHKCHKYPNLRNRIIDLSELCHRFEQVLQTKKQLLPQIWVNHVSDLFSALHLWSLILVSCWSWLQCNNIYVRGRANLLLPAILKLQKWVYLTNTFLAPGPGGVAALVLVSDDGIQMKLLILGRGALSTVQDSSIGSIGDLITQCTIG